MKAPFFLLFVLVLVACSRQEPTDSTPPACVVPLYHYFAADSIPAADSIELKAFLQTVSRQPSGIITAEQWAQSPAVRVFTPDVDSVYTDTSYVSRQLGYILDRASRSGLELPHRRYATVVYGRPEAILFVDSTMLIALNHYLGADYAGYSHLPQYMRPGKTPRALPYDMAEALTATSYPYNIEGDQATALSRMIYEGALAHAKMKLTAGSTPAQALGYDATQMAWLSDNEAALWRALVQKQLLFDTSASTIGRLVEPSPETTLLLPGAPGRAGRYIGWRIVESYLAKHPDSTLAYILSPDFYGDADILSKAAYSPK